MAAEQESKLIRVDMQGPSAASDCFNCVLALPVAVKSMRDSPNGRDVVLMIVGGTADAFSSLQDADLDALLSMAGLAQDRFYRHIAEMTIMDQHTIFYCKFAMRFFFEQLSERGVRTFFILDNTLREDRLGVLLQLFECAGITAVTPSRDGLEWPGLAGKIRGALEAGGHAAYIEPDALVNHLDAAQELARGISCVATFRNLAPGDPRLRIVRMKRS
jgi:hypothetical protein